MSSVEQQLTAMQEQMATLQAQLAQVINPTPMQSEDNTAPPTLHSLSTRPHYEWTPSEAQLEYRSRAIVPSAEQIINKGQKIEDNSLKHLQYQTSAILRPLDVLANEMITHDGNNANLERFCAMLAEMRSLVVDLCSTITQARINIAYRAVNPSFSVKAESDVGYIVPVVPEGLQLSIKIKVFLMGRYVCVVQQHGQAMISEVHLSYLNTEVHQM
ncbi:uncharacterized protein ATC70_007902 [Mucor velutinosus]|uniref:Uncharacterized protein n=1 Tax=Mucor velutinosus TaxID=708070 RepID=A0AAN7D813_9FUNG|nr:hypothetical protein ATC70_007902 [Mucor velutinosus]